MRRRVGRLAPVTGLVAVLVLAGAPAFAATTPTPSPKPSPSPSATATHVATPSPSPSATATSAPTEPIDEHATAALVAATAALVQAESTLAAAQAALATSEAARTAATTTYTRAQTELTAARFAEDRAQRKVDEVSERIAAQAQDIGRLARSTYEANGPLETWSVLLDSTSPGELANRAGLIGAVAGIGNARLAVLSRSRADLVDARDLLRAARVSKQDAEENASLALTARQVEEQAAKDAAAKVAVDVAARAAAMQVALRARNLDLTRYQTLLAVSGHLGERIRLAAARLAASAHPPQGTGHMDRPGRGVVTSPFGPRLHPILHYVKLHTGIDFAKADGIVYAADDGVVLLAERNVAYGNMTVIGHGRLGARGVATLYAHQAAFFVRPGDRVRKGQPIGLIGATGFATGPHLHFEVRLDGTPVDPAPWLVGAPLPAVPPLPLPSVVPVGPPTP